MYYRFNKCKVTDYHGFAFCFDEYDNNPDLDRHNELKKKCNICSEINFLHFFPENLDIGNIVTC